MSDFVFDNALGAVAEKIRDGASALGMLLLKVADTDAVMRTFATVALLLAGTADEATDGSYARKTALTGTITVDTTNHRVDVDVPDQTWTALAGAAITDLITFYQESAADSGRIPLTCHDFAITPDGSDVTAVVNSAGFYRAAG
jgi:hypothetical protein